MALLKTLHLRDDTADYVSRKGESELDRNWGLLKWIKSWSILKKVKVGTQTNQPKDKEIDN